MDWRRLGTESMVHQSDSPRYFLFDGFDQLHHYDYQYARARHEALPHAAGDLVTFHRGDFAAVGPAGFDSGARHAVVRSHGGNTFLQSGRRRRAAALATSVLVLWPSGSLHSHSSGHGYRLGNYARLRAQADFWLSCDGVGDGRN